MLIPYLKYRLRARGASALHSPFVFNYYRDVICFRARKGLPKIWSIQDALYQDHTELTITDFGAGSRKGNQRKVSEIARTAGTSRRWGDFLFKNAERANTIVELGTNVGLGTAHLCIGNPDGHVYSLEGCPEQARVADKVLSENGITNYSIKVGRIQDTLTELLKDLSSIDLAFIDADHTYEATVDFFEMLLTSSHPQTVLIFDDIHWSAEMEKAWLEIQKHPKVTVSIDLFYKGIVFLNPDLTPGHYILKHG